MSKKTLILGPSGSGKTDYCLQQFRENLEKKNEPLEKNFFYLVPSKEHTDRIVSLLVQGGSPGFFNRLVTTLPDLIQDTFSLNRESVATNVARYLALKHVLESQEWEYFGDLQKTSGFINTLLGFITELKESLIRPDSFRTAMNELKKSQENLAPKAETLASLFERYEDELQARGLQDKQDLLEVYRDKKKAGEIKATRFHHLWLDGFFDFSPIQLAYLEELCEISDHVTMTLTLDPKEERWGLFEAVHETREKLKKMGFEEEVLTRKQSSATMLGRLEENLFLERKPEFDSVPQQEVKIFEAVGMEGEIEMIARTILHMQRTQDYRFSDFAILLRHIGSYEAVIRSIFKRYGIPVDIHERERLSFSSFIRPVLKLLKIFIDGWQRADVLDFLKSSYVRHVGSDDRDMKWVYQLESYSLKHGVYQDAEQWLESWEESTNDSNFEKKKKARLTTLAQLEEKLRSVTEYGDYKALLRSAVEDTFAIASPARDISDESKRDAACYKRFLSLLDEIEVSLSRGQGSSDLGFEQFTDRFLRLVDLDLYSISVKNANQVQVYDVSLARQKSYPVVFIAGLLEKQFPVLIKENPVMSDWERKLFNAGSDKGQLQEVLPRQAIERYFFYLAITRAEEKLFLTYPRLDLEGKEYLPSYYVEEVKSIVGGEIVHRKQNLSRPFPEVSEAISRRELELAIMGDLWQPQSLQHTQKATLLSLTQELIRDAETGGRFQKSFFEVQDKLQTEEVKGENPFHPERMSATRLEEYAKCHFRYYAKRVLKLEDPEEDINVLRRGIILHEVLEKSFAKWSRLKKYPSFEAAKKDALKELKSASKEFPLKYSKSYQYHLETEMLEEMLLSFLEYELERVQNDPLKPRYFEYGFGVPDAETPAMEIKTDDGVVRLSGKIDRIDVDEENQVASVLDYKRTASFKRADLELGTALQLPLYSYFIEQQLKLKAIGAELYSIRDFDKKGFYHKNYLDYLPHVSSRRLVLKEDEFKQLQERGLAYLRKFTGEMRKLSIEVRPRHCDSYCPYDSVCRVEKWKLPTILDQIKEEDQREEGINGASERSGTVAR